MRKNIFTIALAPKMLESSEAESYENQLSAKIDSLYAEIARLKEENRDLEIALQATTEHGDLMEAELQEANKKLEAKIVQHEQTEATLQALVEVISTKKADLEIMLETMQEHADIMDVQWYEKVCEAHHLALFDGLTQIPNRRQFDDHLEQQWQQMEQEKSPISLILCDIDFFKQYNDTYGHLAGDECLRRVAQSLHQTMKQPNDLVARYGGEEFAAILPQTNLEEALIVAAKMQAEIQQLAIAHRKSAVSKYITVSMGVVSNIDNYQRSPTSLLDEADQLLYLAKQQGRNRIVYLSSL